MVSNINIQLHFFSQYILFGYIPDHDATTFALLFYAKNQFSFQWYIYAHVNSLQCRINHHDGCSYTSANRLWAITNQHAGLLVTKKTTSLGYTKPYNKPKTVWPLSQFYTPLYLWDGVFLVNRGPGYWLCGWSSRNHNNLYISHLQAMVVHPFCKRQAKLSTTNSGAPFIHTHQL